MMMMMMIMMMIGILPELEGHGAARHDHGRLLEGLGRLLLPLACDHLQNDDEEDSA